MYIYELTFADKDGDRTFVFRHPYQARDYLKRNDKNGSYWLYKIDIGKPSLDLLIEVINSQGGNYVVSRELIEERGAL